MIVCGIQLAGSEARLVILDGTKASYSYVAVRPAKLQVADDEKPEEVRAFQAAIYAFLRENHVERVVIKKRARSGDRAGGPVSFKLEGLVQLYPDAEIVLVAPQTIAAAKRHHAPTVPPNIHKYQEDAFETAFAALE
jgi:hypothetical protein